MAVQLLRVHDVMELCQLQKDRAYAVMKAAGAFKLGSGLRLRPEDLDAYQRQLAEEARAARTESS